jgi:hypothetical protein
MLICRVEDPVTKENGFEVATWVQACEMTISGPSRGKPETNVVKFIVGSSEYLFVMYEFHSVPSLNEIAAARKAIAKSNLARK